MLVLWHSETLAHRAPAGFPETPERVTALVDSLAAVGHQVEQPEIDLMATRVLAERVHGAAYVTRFEAAARRGDGLLDSADNPLVAETFDAALTAAAVVVASVGRAVSTKETVFAAVRPPGHHCEREMAMGFCYLANAAIAVEAARDLGLERIAIYDLDVHHGNGTQHLFEHDPQVLFVSTHQYPFYPGTGAAGERGLGAGEGATVNVPLAAGTDEVHFLAAVERQVVPAVRRHQPQLLVLSAGFDGWRGDPLGGFVLEVETFRLLGITLGRLARECAAPVVALLEGGYDRARLGSLADALLVGLAEGGR